MLRRLRVNALEVLATEGYFSPQVAVEPDASLKARHCAAGRSGAACAGRGGPDPVHRRDREAMRNGSGGSSRAGNWPPASRFAIRPGRRPRPAAEQRARARFPGGPDRRLAAEVDADNATVRLRVEIDSGPAFTLGRTEIKGLERYDEQAGAALQPVRARGPLRRRPDAGISAQAAALAVLHFRHRRCRRRTGRPRARRSGSR